MAIEEKVEVVWHENSVSRADREKLNGNKGGILWFTGLSACGKSTVANVLDHKLNQMGVHSVVLDGDNVRHGLNAAPNTVSLCPALISVTSFAVAVSYTRIS